MCRQTQEYLSYQLNYKPHVHIRQQKLPAQNTLCRKNHLLLSDGTNPLQNIRQLVLQFTFPLIPTLLLLGDLLRMAEAKLHCWLEFQVLHHAGLAILCDHGQQPFHVELDILLIAPQIP